MIETEMGACWTIAFLNKSCENPTPTVWVCVSKKAYDCSLAKLQSLRHIEIVQHGPSRVQE